MKFFKKNEDDFSRASMTAFEELVLGKKKEINPIIKGGSMVLYVTVAVAVVAVVGNGSWQLHWTYNNKFEVHFSV